MDIQNFDNNSTTFNRYKSLFIKVVVVAIEDCYGNNPKYQKDAVYFLESGYCKNLLEICEIQELSISIISAAIQYAKTYCL